MRLRHALALACVLAAVAGGAAVASDPAAESPASGAGVRTITLVHTNDLHAHSETFAAVAHVVRTERKRNPATLVLDAGDCITGTPLSTVFQGTPVFELMNAIGYDAGAIGNHEFDHGWKRVHTFRDVAEHPLLCANATDPDGKAFGDAPSKVFDVGGVRVAVLGLVTSDVPELTTAAASAGCRFESPIAAAKRHVPELRKQADVVVALTHVGVEGDAAVAGAVPGIDVVVGGHSHTKLEKALDVGGARVVQAWCYGRAVGVVDLDWDPAARKVVRFAYRLVVLDPETAVKDPQVQALVASWDAKTDAADPGAAEVVGRTERPLSKRDLRPLLEHIYREALGTDLGFQNEGGIRATIEAGDIRARDIGTVLPFDNTLVTLRLPGAQLPEWARKALGDRFVADRDYTVATNSFVADQQRKYFGTSGLVAEDSGLSMRDVVVAWVRRHGGFRPAPGPKSPPPKSPPPKSPPPSAPPAPDTPPR